MLNASLSVRYIYCLITCEFFGISMTYTIFVILFVFKTPSIIIHQMKQIKVTTLVVHVFFLIWICLIIILIYTIPCFLLDILLDMKASGGELGWLTSPNEEGVSLKRFIEKLHIFNPLYLWVRDPTCQLFCWMWFVIWLVFLLWLFFFNEAYIITYRIFFLIVLSGGTFSILLLRSVSCWNYMIHISDLIMWTVLWLNRSHEQCYTEGTERHQMSGLEGVYSPLSLVMQFPFWGTGGNGDMVRGSSELLYFRELLGLKESSGDSFCGSRASWEIYTPSLFS